MITATAETAKVLGISPASLQDLFNEYKKAQEQNPDAPAGLIANTQTALRRYVAPALGGPSLEGLDRTEAAIASQGFLTTVPPARFASVMADLDRYFEEASIPKKAQDSTRSYVRKLLDWSKSMGCGVTVSEAVSATTAFEPYRFHDPDRDLSIKGYQIPVTGKPRKETYGLGAVEGDYLNKDLSEQLASFEQHLGERELAPDSQALTLRLLKTVLGWLVLDKRDPYKRDPQNVPDPFAALTFESVIQKVQLYPKRDDFQTRSAWVDAKDDAKDKATEVARKDMKRIEAFLAFYSANSHSRLSVLNSLIHAAEFLYEDITQDDDEPFHDIPIIKLLRLKRKAVSQKQQAPVVPIENKTLDNWHEVVKVLKRLKVEADMTHTDVKQPACRGGYSPKARSKTAIASSCRRFLSAAFLVLLPPDRVQLLHSLEPGVTLLRGSVKGRFPNERFTSAEKMKDPSKAFWYIKLTSYKTVAAHGVFHMPVPDCWLGTKSFYQYIDEWLTVHRPLYKPKHNYFFSAANGNVVLRVVFGKQLTKSFTRLSGKPVGPHMLRHIYRTDINNIDFAAETDGFKAMVSETVGKMMRHTSKIANTKYDHADLQARFMHTHAYNWVKYFEPVFGSDPRPNNAE